MNRLARDAATDVTRTITIIWGAATLAFLAISVGPIVGAAPAVDPTYGWVAVVIVFVAPVLIAVAALILPRRTLQRLLGAYALAYLGLVGLWIVALGGRTLPLGAAPWIVEITALATVPATLAWRPAFAWTYLAVNAALIVPVRLVSSGLDDATTPFQYAFFTLTYTAIFSMVGDAAVRNGIALDAATTQTRRVAEAAAAATAQRQEQARLDALVHDAVMGTLYYAAQGRNELDPAVRRQAQSALATLERLRSNSGVGASEVSAEVFVARIRSLVLDLSAGIPITIVGDRDDTIPGEVAAAFAEATAEAVRNSVQHAGGPSVERSVQIELTATRITVVIADAGRGFDRRGIAPHRLGIPVSIRGRLGALEGGRARVESRTGRGTRVRLEWTAP